MGARAVPYHINPFRAAEIARESLFDHLHAIKHQPVKARATGQPQRRVTFMVRGAA